MTDRFNLRWSMRRWPQRCFWVCLWALWAVLGCSKTMTIYTVPRHPEAEIYVNGQLRGKGSAQVKVNLGECEPHNMGVSARLGPCEIHQEVRTQFNTAALAPNLAVAGAGSIFIALAAQGEWWGWAFSALLAASGIAAAACNHEWPDSVAIPIQQCLSTSSWAVTVEDIPLYVAPSFGARVLRVLPRHTCIRIEYCQEEWCQVTILRPVTEMKGPASGFVHRPRLQPAGPSECPGDGS